MTVEEMKNIDVRTVSRDDLVDIRDVVIDRSQPKEERIRSFILQIKKGCSTHSIDVNELMDAVLTATRGHVEMILEIAKTIEAVESLPEQQRGMLNFDAQIVRLKEEIEKNEAFKLKLYENLQDEIISQEEYFLFKKNYSDKIHKAEESIRLLEEDRERMQSSGKERLAWMEVFKKYANLTKLDRVAVVELIECVYVYEDHRVDVVFRYKDECEKTFELMKSMPVEIEQAV